MKITGAGARSPVVQRPRQEEEKDPAGLNFGDCLTYAVARLSGEPLLFVDEDFPKTGLESAQRSRCLSGWGSPTDFAGGGVTS